MISSPNRGTVTLLLALFVSLTVFSQEPVTVERSTNKVILEGKVYYIHIVEPGQTLYAISRAYHVSQKEITVENPGVVSGIRIGQALKIPVEPSLEEEIDTSVEEEVPEGRHTHTVKEGETLYSISRIYGLSEEVLREANPAVRPEFLRPGQRLLIPESVQEAVETEPEPAYNEEGFAYHKVKKRETLYSIARYYGITVQAIRAANPELGWGGPKTDQVIRIPLPQVTDRNGLTEEAGARDSLLAQEVPLEPYFYEEDELLHNDPRHTYRIAYFIPFDFQEPEPLDSLIKDVNSASRRNRIIERYRMEQKVPQSVNFLEFFQGCLMAIDSMRQTGMRLDVRFYDTHKSMEETRLLLEDRDMRNMDLIIGPFYPFNLEIVADFAKRHRIPLVTPFYNEKQYIWDNPYLFQLSPSIEAGYRELAKLVASKYTYNIVYVREEDTLDVERHGYLKELIYDGFDDYRPEEPVIFKEMVLTLQHTDEIIHSLSTDRKNLIVVPTRNEALASRVVSLLYYRLKDYDIEVIGTPYWSEFTSIDYRYFHELSLVFYSSFWVDFLDPKVDAFMTRYRGHFYAEPGQSTRRGINYGIAGYDITLYFTNALRMYGKRFIVSLDEYEPTLVMEPYRFTRVTGAGGYENVAIRFYQFLPDMSIREIQVPELPVRDYFFRPMEDRRRKFLNFDWDDRQ